MAAWRTVTLVAMAIAGVVVLTAIVITLGEANRQRDRALAAQSHSYDVMNLARALQGTMAKSEASLGRYVISADQQLGQSYFDDWRRAGENVAQLHRLTHDNAGQQRRLALLEQAFRARGAELAATALATNYGKNGQALSRFYRDRTSSSLEAINAALDGLIADERALLQRRTSQAMTSVRQSTAAAKILSIFGVLLLLGMIALGWLTMRALADRGVAQAEAAAERQRADDLADAVAAATDELRVQEARLRQVQKMEAVGQLTGGIAHDFNNMLAIVIGGLELARRGLLAGNRDVLRHVDSASEGATRAAALTRRLLAFARETAINPECIDAARLFDGLKDLLDRTLGDGVTVVIDDASDGWCARVDRVQLENTLVNLAVNARDAMDGRGTLTIAASARTLTTPSEHGCAPGDYLVLAVTDTGHGMSDAVIERAFEPFFTTKPVGKGTGLGLSQIFSFAKQVGGDVTIASQLGHGTTVTLLLPREAKDLGTATEQIAPTTEAHFDRGGSLSILVVEDDPRVLAATVEALEELGHCVAQCNDSLRAAAVLDSMPRPDLLVSDVLMPGLTGPEMVAAFDARFRNMPVLFVTGFAGDAAQTTDLANRPVLRKPFTLAALERAVLSATRCEGPHAIAAE
ncbi:response regulator [Sphingomonas sp. HHU CXW]|uniref:histidine kinase n=1 Tax=Sphingomonas hominis TaxID=2741495 RepID=A0ABX2JI67_9SPHN|nr:ATP-binding protein [Sphingomonas hominis]NTS65160.1 response regulator [Sphingomonas hominis]